MNTTITPSPPRITKKYIKDTLGLDLNIDCESRRREHLKENPVLPSHPFMDDKAVTTSSAPFTKEMLLNLLSFYNIGNRPIKEGKMSSLAKDMIEGNWLSTGDTIKFGDQGNGYGILDGQHRMLALLLAKEVKGDEFNVCLDVASGRDARIKVKIDRQQPRSQKDHLWMNHPEIVPNKTSAGIAADVAKRILKHYLKPVDQVIVCASSDPTDEEVDNFLVKNQDSVHLVLSYLTEARSERPCSADNLKKLRKTAVVNALMRFGMANLPACELFLKIFVSGQADTDADFTIIKLRDYVLNTNAQSSTRGKRGTGYDDLYAKTISSYSNWSQGIQIKKLVKQKNWESFDFSKLAPAL